MEPSASASELTTLVAGATQWSFRADGSVDPSTTAGLYHRDVRLVSGSTMSIDGASPTLLVTDRHGPATSHQVFALRHQPDRSPTVLLHRRRELTGAAAVDHYSVSCYDEPLVGELRLTYEHDLMDVVAIKTGETPPAPRSVTGVAGGWSVAGGRFGVSVCARPDARIDGSTFVWSLDVPAGANWSATVTHTPQVDGRDVEVAPSTQAPDRSALVVSGGDRGLTVGVRAAAEDRDALRVHVPELDLAYLGAGVPWYMALFGRDTLLTAMGSMVAGTGVGLEVAEALARYQGRGHDAATAEQPGRILHELRTGGAEVFGVPSGTPYYGTVDASPLFVMLLGELHRWGADPSRLQALLPAARAAVAWCTDHGDLDGDGFVEYLPDLAGLKNQGWKDSDDPMVHADGREASGSIALAEVQAYLYAAYRDLAELEEAYGDGHAASGLRRRAAALRDRFLAAFWLPEQRIVAMALDGTKRPLAVASSNMGHVLWTGILDDEVGGAVADRLAEPNLLTAWGIRTLAATERAYSPLSYHRGSIWPHDSMICAAGLARYGRTAAAMRLGTGLLATAERFAWRLPELFGGQDETEVPFPVPYPVACSPQAWSSVVPLGVLRLALGLDPDVPAGRVRLGSRLPEDVTLQVAGIQIGDGHLEVEVRGGVVEVLASPPGLLVVDA